MAGWGIDRLAVTPKAYLSSMNVCRADDCTKKVCAKGLCSTHYARWRRNGDPNIYQSRYKPVEDRFWAKVVRHDEGCWEWTGCRDNHGYGCLWVEPAMEKGHRVSWTIHNGPIPDGLFVRHRCDNPPCTRPDHLVLGTQLDNMADMYARGRGRKQRGIRVLTPEAIADIQARYSYRKVTEKQLGVEYGVSVSTIRKALRTSLAA